MTETQTQPKFSAEMWAAFWAAPDVRGSATSSPTTSSATGRATRSPVRGRTPTPARSPSSSPPPDLALELVDSATVDGETPGEQLVFLHYVGRGTGPDGPFAIRGLDRVRTRDGIVVENVIRYDQVEPASIGRRSAR